MSSKMMADHPSPPDRKPLRRFFGVFRRLNVRLTLWFTLIFVFGSIVVFGLTFANLYRELRFEDQTEIQTVALSHWARFQTAANPANGVTTIVNTIEAQGLQSAGKPHFVRIATADNQSVYVRYPLPEWQQDFDLTTLLYAPEPHRQGFVSIFSDTLGYHLEVFALELSPNLILQLGYDTRDRARVLRIFQRSFVVIFVLLLGMSLIGGLFFVSRTLRPLGTLNNEIRRIVDTAQLDHRLGSLGSGDDLDHLIESFNAMLDRLQRLVFSLTDALDSVAHDLRTPMTRFRTIAERALASGAPTLQSEALSDALEESDRILSMLDSMMDISEAESGAMQLKRVPVDLADLCRTTADVYSIVAEERGMTIAVDAEPGLTSSGDLSRLRQVVGNLLDNAIKYGDQGSQIEVSVQTGDPSAPIRESVIQVSNHGQTIPADVIPRIWDRLYRGPHDSRSDGIGLGLTLVKAIVVAHGGRVDVQSGSGVTAFSIVIPDHP